MGIKGRQWLLGMAMLLSGINLSFSKSLVETAEPYKGFRGFRQFQGENICWALAAKAVLVPLLGTAPAVCKIISKTTGRSCCSYNNHVAEECNKQGRAERVMRAYNIKSQNISADSFESVFQTLKAKGLATITMDVNQSSWGERLGHEAVIYKSHKYNDGSYEFFVADSTYGNYVVDTSELKLTKKGKLRHRSWEHSFDWESSTLIYKPQRLFFLEDFDLQYALEQDIYKWF